ncbi:MAG: GDSL-type esterase/lipase family protein [Geminicoccaceae bacterium]
MAGLLFGRSDAAPEAERPRRVLVFGDSLSWGWVPQRTFIPSERFPPDRQWPRVMGAALGAGYEVVVDAMSGRTTDADDPLAPQIPGVGTNGLACLPATLAAHLPLDLVVLLLGSNDCKPQFARSALRIALGAGRLIETVQRSADLFGTMWLANPAPPVLLVCPPPFGKFVRAADELFAGAHERGAGLAAAYAHVAAAARVAFFDAGSVVTSDGVDGVHLTGESQQKLGLAMADQVRAVLADTERQN